MGGHTLTFYGAYARYHRFGDEIIARFKFRLADFMAILRPSTELHQSKKLLVRSNPFESKCLAS